MGVNRTPEKTIQKKITEFTRKRPASDDGSDQPAQKSNRTSDSEENITLQSNSELSQTSSNMDKNPQNAGADFNLEKILAAIGRLENKQERSSEEIITKVTDLDSKLVTMQERY